jgi:nicotinate-nucleotide adenylyltransferase
MHVVKLGILGGTFNPIHNGHLRIAETAREYLALDQVLLITSGYSYMKDKAEIAPAKARFAMTELAIDGNPYLNTTDIEIIRPGPTYTYETIAQLKAIYPDALIHFIVGSDTLCGMEQWVNPEYIFRNTVICVFIRGEEKSNDLHDFITTLNARYNADIHIIPMEQINISSRMIRQYIKDKDSIDDLIPTAVMKYIRMNDLYI